MTGMNPIKLALDGERLVGALIPAAPHRPEPSPISLPPLPVPPRASSALVLDMARPDASGRVCVRGLMRALGWTPGHRLDLTIVAQAVVLTTSTTGQHAVTAQRSVKLPAAVRRLVGMRRGEPVLLAACPADDILVAVSASLVGDWLRRWFADAAGAA